LAQKLPSGCVGCEVVGCRAAEHREKADGIDQARRDILAQQKAAPQLDDDRLLIDDDLLDELANELCSFPR
jgi:hypothetical protein